MGKQRSPTAAGNPDPERKIHTLGKEYTRYGRWITPVPIEFKFYRLIEAMGARSYRASKRRRAKALAVSDAAARHAGLALARGRGHASFAEPQRPIYPMLSRRIPTQLLRAKQ